MAEQRSTMEMLGDILVDTDSVYDLGISTGAYGGKLLGSGGGGYILFLHPPKKRNKLVETLRGEGGEILDFNFESRGVQTWHAKSF